MCVSARNTEVEFRHEQARTEFQRGPRNGRDGGNRRRARCSHRGSGGLVGARGRDPAGGSAEGVGERSALPIEVEPAAKRQLADAHAWWEVNRPAAPNAIRDDFREMTRTLARTPRIGPRATDTRTPDVRKVFLPRVGFVIYYRVIGSPPILEIMAFWHARRGKGPPI